MKVVNEKLGATGGSKKTPRTDKEAKEALVKEDELAKVADLRRPGRRPQLTKGT